MVSCTDKPRGAAGSPGSLALNSQNQPGLVILGEGVRRLPASIPATQPVPKPLFCPYGVCCSMRVEFSSLLIIIPMYEAQDRSWPGNHSDQRGSEGGLSSRNPLTHAPGWWESRDGLHRPTGTSRFRAETPPGQESKLTAWPTRSCLQSTLRDPALPRYTNGWQIPSAHSPALCSQQMGRLIKQDGARG